MDSNNFKKLFGNFLGKKRTTSTNNIKENNKEKENNNVIEKDIDIEKITYTNENKIKKYVKYGDIINQKIKENSRNEDLLKNFEKNKHKNEDLNESIIVKTAEIIKQKNKKFEEEKEKLKEIEILEKEKDKDKDKIGKSTDNDDDSFDSLYGSDKEFKENITCIPKEFHIEVCNKEWVLNVDTKKYKKN
jgi:hypothetical protein